MQDWINAFLSWIPYILSGVTLLASGGGIAALVTGLANRLSTKRQNEIEIKKHRMDIYLNMHLSIIDYHYIQLGIFHGKYKRLRKMKQKLIIH
jgi:hypothetical protein